MDLFKTTRLCRSHLSVLVGVVSIPLPCLRTASPFGKCGSWRDMVTIVLIWNATWQSKGFLPKSHYNIGKLSRSGCASRHTLLDAIFVLPWKTFIHHLPTLTAPNKTTTPIHLQSSTHLHPLSLVPRYFPSPSLSAELRDVKKEKEKQESCVWPSLWVC